MRASTGARFRTPVVRCPVCQKKVSAQVPRRGDGSALKVRRHPRGAEVPCPGSLMIVDRGQALEDYRIHDLAAERDAFRSELASFSHERLRTEAANRSLKKQVKALEKKLRRLGPGAAGLATQVREREGTIRQLQADLRQAHQLLEDERLEAREPDPGQDGRP